MHVGWAATFAPPENGYPRPSFFELRDHVATRLSRAPRYRQKLAGVPLGVNDPVWWTTTTSTSRATSGARVGLAGGDRRRGDVQPLARDQPLWELWISTRLDDGRVGIVGKAHHCMVDGLAAVELASLLLDPTPETPPPPRDDWSPAPRPSDTELLADGVRDRVSDATELATLPLRLLLNPARAVDFRGERRATRGRSSTPCQPRRPPC